MIAAPIKIELPEAPRRAAREAGRRAFRRGVELDQNPYPKSSEQGKAWKEGFLDAWADHFCKKGFK